MVLFLAIMEHARHFYESGRPRLTLALGAAIVVLQCGCALQLRSILSNKTSHQTEENAPPQKAKRLTIDAFKECQPSDDEDDGDNESEDACRVA